MNLVELVQKVRTLVGLVRAGDYVAAMLLTLEIIRAIAASLQASTIGNDRAGVMHGIDLDAMTVEELADELEKCCTDLEPTADASVMMSAPPAGPFIDKFLPILLALLTKWLGL